MENLLEILVPLIFAAVYFFGNLLSRKTEEEDENRPPTLPPQPSDRGEPENYADRQRQIQEAIRRKIMERRQAASEGAGEAVPADRVAAHQEKLKEVHERHKEVHQREPHLEPTPGAHEEAPAVFSWDASDNVYEQEMQARLQQIEATKRRAEALRQQSGATPSAAAIPRGVVRDSGRSTRRGLLSGPVREVLKNPAAARTAFIYGEVLGQPVSLRKSGSGVAN